jgi:cytochrome c oxidase subunit 2
VNRFWAILFLLVPLLGVASYGLAAFQIWPMQGLWLPDNYSRAGETIDFLWTVIHVIGGFILLGTGLVLAYSIWTFGSARRQQARYFCHNTRLEIIWSIIPCGILIFIAVFQMQSWEDNKLNQPMVMVDGVSIPQTPLARVVARRFGWEVYYPGPDGRLETADDIYVENELIVPANENVVLQLESRDVIHSFFVPNLRLKQDILPGRQHLVWFRATQTAETEIVCAELCGWGHYTMQAKLKIVSREAYDAWMAERTQRLSNTDEEQ